MEYVPGGDFRTLLNNSGVLKESHARFYISEMFAGVNELHKLGYIHRDLKPEVEAIRLYRKLSNDSLELSSGWHRSCKIDRLWACNRCTEPTSHRRPQAEGKYWLIDYQ